MPIPPAPPPPPPLLHTQTPLSFSRRTPANSDREKYRPVPAPSPSAGTRLDPATLQHAAAGLRKTVHDEPLRSDFEDLSYGRLDRANQQLFGRHWSDRTIHEPLGANAPRTSLHATSSGAGHAVPLGNVHRHPNTLSQPVNDRSKTYSSSYSEYSYHQQSSTSPGHSSYISDPRAHIRAYATQTPASQVLDGAATTERHHYSTPRQVKDTDRFARELRDQGLTRTQRIANQYRDSQLQDRPLPKSFDTLYREKPYQNGVDQIDHLIKDMEWKMRTGHGAAGENNCSKCGEGISNARPGCIALDRTFHIDCFTCEQCGLQLAGASFYNVEGKAMCEKDYLNTLERCTACGQPIAEKLLRASGSTYHPACFVCSVCRRCLDGVPFTVDTDNKIHCVSCFHDKFAPRCAVCSKPIVPQEGEKESVRVVAMDKSFHVDCYRCEDCNLQLSSKLEGHGCYPLDQHLYCKDCNSKRLIALSNAA